MNWISYKSSLTEEDIDCVKALNVWNFLADVASSLPDRASEFLALDTKPNAVYDKLFWGNNLPAVTPPGEEYQPAWSHDELSKMQSLFLSGITLLKNNLADHESSSQAVGIIR